MMSLFTPFDYGLFSLPIFFMFLILTYLFTNFYLISFLNLNFKEISIYLSNFFCTLKPKMMNKFSMMIFISFFFYLFLSNIFSVFCFNFPQNSQVSVVFSFSFTIWLSFFMFFFFFNFKGYVSHLIPGGTPLGLSLIMFLVELMSVFIRPLTLMVRLVANIVAGHVMMGLLSKLIFLSPFCYPLFMMLTFIEMFVSLIQSYIFVTLMVLYFSEC